MGLENYIKKEELNHKERGCRPILVDRRRTRAWLRKCNGHVNESIRFILYEENKPHPPIRF